MARDHSSHQALKTALEDLLDKTLLVAGRCERLPAGTEAVAPISRKVHQAAAIVLCGAGISVSGPSYAPSFASIRLALIQACTATLHKRDALQTADKRSFIDAVMRFPRRPGIEFPPEVIFSQIQAYLGEEQITELLKCLNWGKPNSNHLALGRLFSSDRPPNGMITTNFDTYIEQGQNKERFSVILPHSTSLTGNRPILIKPHGSLSESKSIIITVERIAERVTPSIFSAIKFLLTNRDVVVVGYSGYDYDVLAVLVHAMKSWGTSITWVLFDQTSYNSRIAAAELAVPNRLTVVNANREPVFFKPDDQAGADTPPIDRGSELCRHFENTFDTASTSSLLGLLLTMGGPIGLSSLWPKLCIELFDHLRTDSSLSIERRLNLARILANGGAEHPRAREFLGLGVEIASEMPDKRWWRFFRNKVNQVGKEKGDPNVELEEIDFQLRERTSFWPTPEHMWPALRLGLLVDRVEALSRKGDNTRVIIDGNRLLREETFPEAPIPGQSITTFDTQFEGDLHYAMANALLNIGDEATAALHIASAIRIFVRELNCFQTLHAVAMAERIRCRDCSELAMDLSKRIARLAGLLWEEVMLTSIWLSNGDGTKEDLDRTEYLLATFDFSEDERTTIKEWLSRVDRNRLSM